MKHLIEFPLDGGGSIVVEVDEPEGGMVRAARPGEIAAKASQTFEDALERIKPAASAIIAKLRDLSESPDEVDVEFGLKLSADLGAFIASAGAEANFNVTLTWKRKERYE
ncbi:MAG: CU044_2847 family protein [Candidatus Bipolaricaulia bacterium]